MRLVKSNHNIPAPELDSFPDSSSPDSSSPGTIPIPDGSSAEAGFIPVKFSPEADSKNRLSHGANLYLEIWFFEAFCAS